MSTLIPTLAAVGPLAAGWSAHSLWLRRQVAIARRDPLTGLPTRATFERQAARILARRHAAVALVDLDGFKALNDRYGHAAGDTALTTVAGRLTECVGKQGIAARLGGDEFALVLSTPAHRLRLHMSLLHACLVEPFDHDGHTLNVGASIGAVSTTPGAQTPPALRTADECMYVAKRGGGGWLTADTPEPTHTTTAGRRTGRTGATQGGARP